MTTRFDAKSRTRFNVPGLPSGYQSKSAPSDLVIPSVGIDDVNRALFKLFDKEIPFTIDGSGSQIKKVPVIMAAGEKWALNKKMRAIRDRNHSLILPIITIVPNIIMQSFESDIGGRGINQQTGEIVIRRRLDKSDRTYQALINRLFLKHQPNLAVPTDVADPMQLSTTRAIGDMADDQTVRQGGLLVPDRLNNVWETIVVPAPQFFTAQYDCTIWTQYTSHMNQLIEMLISSFLPQGNQWKLDTPKGYWFVATVTDNTYTTDGNTDDYSQTERLVRYKFTVTVPGYILATSVPGAPVPLKRYVSNPIIEFSTGIGEDEATQQTSTVTDPFLGADDPTLPIASDNDGPVARRDQRETGATRLYPNESVVTNPNDPAVKKLPRGVSPQYKKVTGIDSRGNLVTRLFRVTVTNQFTGETVLSAADASLGGITIVSIGD